jgi:LytS/YehU family sensor histidine kinase
VILYCLAGLAVVGIVYPIIAQLLALLPMTARLGNIFAENPFAFENGFGAIVIILLSLPVVLALQWSKQNSRIISLEKEKAQTELDLLKQQLNPHFFFNTLNNLYALSLQQSKQTPESILQLSELMRYVIYKAKEPTVQVQEEIKYLEDYMQLQQIRLKRKPDVQFKQEIGDGTPPIAPLLLIVLVENAFKHGIEPAEEKAFLHLSLHTTANRLYFSCTNSVEQDAEQTAGIGLANLLRRLVLLYPGKHLLRTGIENHIFKAELELDLS